MKKLESLQMLRAVAALLVVWAHSIDRFAHHPSFQASFYHLQNLGAVGVDIFFCISGFIMSTVACRSKSVAEFAVKRACRILPILWLLLLYHAVKSYIPFNTFLQNLLLLPNTEPVISLSWTLIFEWYFYVILAISLLVDKTRCIQITMYFIMATVVAGWIIRPSSTALLYYTNPIMLEFVLGVIVGLIWSRRPSIPRWMAATLFTVGGIWLAATVFTGYRDVSQSYYTIMGLRSLDRFLIWGIPSAFLVAGVVFLPSIASSAFTKLMVYLGDASYSIYLVHLYGLAASIWILKRLPMHMNADISILLCLVMAAAFSCCFHSFIERPITRLLNKRVVCLVK